MNAVYHEYDENPVRKTLKQRKKKKLKRKVKILLVLCLLIILAFYLISDYSKVKSIHISGNSLTEKEEILEHITISQSSYYMFMNTHKIEKQIKLLPAIKEATVQCDWVGNIKIEVQEAQPIAYAKINKDIYEINNIVNIIKTTDQDRISLLKSLPYVSEFKEEKLLKQFAEGFKDVPTLMQNEISDIILSPQRGDETRLKCLLKGDKILYIRIEDLSTRLDDEIFNYEAYKTKYKDKYSFSIEGIHLYLE